MTQTKKIIIGILILAVLGGVGLWLWMQKGTPANQVSTGGFSIKNFLPFGSGEENPIDQNGSNTPDENQGTQGITQSSPSTQSNGFANPGVSPLTKLRKLSEAPTAGAILMADKGTTTVIRFVEKATGNVYEATSNSSNIKRLTNETIPAISRAIWLKDGSGFFTQKVGENDIVETSFIKLKQNTGTSTSGVPYATIISNLPTGIAELTVSPDSKKVFYLTKESGAKGFVSNPDGTSPVSVFSNFLSEWVPEWLSANSILIKSKASSEERSFGFILNPNTKSVSEAYSNILGGSALGRGDAKSILLSTGGTPRLFIKNTDSDLTSLEIKTISDKCAWNTADVKFIYCAVPKSINGSWPDSWYKGEVKTNDTIQKINVADIYTYIVIDLEETSKENIDAQNLQVSKDGQFTLFENRIDKTLWVLTN